MDLKNAVLEINSQYRTNKVASDIYEIQTDRMFNAFNYFYIALRQKEGKLYLSDFANTCEIIDLKEEQYEEVCKKHNISFDDYHIVTEYKGLESLNKFIECLEEISNLQ